MNMRMNKNFWLTGCGTLAAVGIATLVTAHRIDAQYASPVKVLNTSSAPAIGSSIDDPGRVAYAAQRTGVGCAGSSNQCDIFFPNVPAGHRLVVEGVSTIAIFSANPVMVKVYTNNGVLAGFPAPFAFDASGPDYFSLGYQALRNYWDAGGLPAITVQPLAGSFSSNPVAVITGYLLDCSAAPCTSPIVH